MKEAILKEVQQKVLQDREIDSIFFELYEKYSSKYYNLIFAWAEDEKIAQDILYRGFLQIHREFASRPDSEEAVSDWMLDIMRNLTCAALANIDLSRNNISISVAEFIEKECKDNIPLQFRK